MNAVPEKGQDHGTFDLHKHGAPGAAMRITFRGLALLSCLTVMTPMSGAFAAQDRQARVPHYRPNSFTLTDEQGDANGLNGQAFYDTGSHPGPVHKDSADLLKVEYASTGSMAMKGGRFTPQCEGFTAKVTLAAAPTADTYFRLIGKSVVNDGQWWLEYYGGTHVDIRYSNIQDASENYVHRTALISPVKLVGSTFTFTVTGADINTTGESLAAFEIRRPSAHSRAYISGYTPVAWDETKTYDGSFKPC